MTQRCLSIQPLIHLAACFPGADCKLVMEIIVNVVPADLKRQVRTALYIHQCIMTSRMSCLGIIRVRCEQQAAVTQSINNIRVVHMFS